ncbi:MAG: polysaccharide biosynthesis C-terminal domain-containing protein [Crocinitomicaceae bacterium]
MLLKILSTVFSKVFTAGIGFIVVIITARALGAAVRGDIALLLLNISIIGLFQGIFNGSVLVYLTPKFSFLKLFIATNLFSFALAVGLPFVMVFFRILESNQLNELILLSSVQGLLTTSQSLLLGKDKIQYFNLLEIIKSTILFLSILFFFWGMNNISLEAVMHSYLLSYSIPLIISLFQLIPYINDTAPSNSEQKSILKSFFKYGFEIQINNISHMINYRFCFYIIEKWKGKDALGIFSIALSLCELVWIIAKSISTFQYSKIVNTRDPEVHRKLTIHSIQLSFIATIPLLLTLLVLPDAVYTFVFGKEFSSIKTVLYFLSLGILSLSIFTIINHYFSGIGENKPNIISSFIGNVIVVSLCLTLIPIWGNIGAGIATSITYFVILSYIVYRFLKQTNSQLKELIPTSASIKSLLQELKN